MPTPSFPANMGKQKNTNLRPLSPLHATKFTWMTTYVQNLSPSEKAKFRKLREDRRRHRWKKWMEARERLAEVSTKVFETPDLARILMTHMSAHSDKNDMLSFLQINKVTHSVGSDLRGRLRPCIQLQLCSNKDYDCTLELATFCSFELFSQFIPPSIVEYIDSPLLGHWNIDNWHISQSFKLDQSTENGFDESVLNTEWDDREDEVCNRLHEVLTEEYAFRLSILAMFLKFMAVDERTNIHFRMKYVTPKCTMYDTDSNQDLPIAIENRQINIENTRQERFLGIANILRKVFTERINFLSFTLRLYMRNYEEYRSYSLTPLQESLLQYLFLSHRFFRLELCVIFTDPGYINKAFQRYFNCDYSYRILTEPEDNFDTCIYELVYIFNCTQYEIGHARRMWDFANNHIYGDEGIFI